MARFRKEQCGIRTVLRRFRLLAGRGRWFETQPTLPALCPRGGGAQLLCVGCFIDGSHMHGLYFMLVNYSILGAFAYSLQFA
jgi:hypothetical protein